MEIVELECEPMTIEAGQTIALTYTILADSDHPFEVWLGASVLDAAGKEYYNVGQDEIVSVRSGKTILTRLLTVPRHARPGRYRLVGAVWSRRPGGPDSKRLASMDHDRVLDVRESLEAEHLALRHLQDGALVKEEADPRQYVVYGRAKFWIQSPEEVRALGFRPADLVEVPRGSLARCGRIPIDWTWLRERSDDRLFLVAHGRRFQITDAELLPSKGAEHRVGVVPNGSLQQIPIGGTEKDLERPPFWPESATAAG